MRVAGLVLAAGRATRFGATKQLHEVGGTPLVRIVADTAFAAGLEPVAVVVGHDADRVAAALPGAATVVPNPAHAAGQSTSVAAGLRALARLDDEAPVDAAVVLLADEPGVRTDVVRAVVDALHAGADLVRCRYEDRPGHPVGIARGRWADATAATGDVGARDLLRRAPTVVVPVAGRAPLDVDTPADADRIDPD